MSATLNATINRQLTLRTKRNEAGKLLCRRCNSVVPPDYSIVFWDPSDETKVWGPCCSDECICHLKICSECNQDFIIDKDGDITHVGDGVWLCKTCITKAEVCLRCNRRGSLVDSPTGKMCKGCFDKKYFTCKDCGTIKVKSDSVSYGVSVLEQVQWSHVLEREEGKLCTKCFDKRKRGKEPLHVASCNYCNNVYTLTGARSDRYCEHCIDRGDVRLCNHCGEYVTRWDHIGGAVYCRTCIPKLTLCSCCKEKGVFLGSAVKYKGKSRTYAICNDCASSSSLKECPSCMSLTKSPLKKVKGKKDVCSHCQSKYNWCPDCEQFHFGERACRSERATVCEYSYKPHPYFNGSLNDRVFFGFENEINYSDKNYEEAKDTVIRSYPSSVLYAKWDGSISGQGFEVVSHPMTLDFFNGLDLEPMFRVKPKDRDTSCGLHVHISRSAFNGQAHLFKLTEFINNNKAFTKKVAGRDFNSYAREYREKISKAVKGTAGRERYHAVNLTNKSTVEIRIFKSARNEFQLRYRIEFVSAVIEFTRNSSIKSLSEPFFNSWLVAQPGYQRLKKFLKLFK